MTPGSSTPDAAPVLQLMYGAEVVVARRCRIAVHGSAQVTQPISRKARVFWPLFLTVFLADCTTKELAVERLSPLGTSHSVIGNIFKLTLAYNEGAAMGLPVGDVHTAVLGALSLLVGLLIFVWYRNVPRDGRLPAAALALVLAGALGNGWERLLSGRGVVDFIDLGLGSYRFYVFNVADVGITVGAILLATWLWLEDRSPAHPPSGSPSQSSSTSTARV